MYTARMEAKVANFTPSHPHLSLQESKKAKLIRQYFTRFCRRFREERITEDTKENGTLGGKQHKSMEIKLC